MIEVLDQAKPPEIRRGKASQVGPAKQGDVITGGITGVMEISFDVVQRS